MSVMRRVRGKFSRVWRGINKSCIRAAPLWLLGGESRELPIAHIGSGDGQWDIPANLVDTSWNCYSVGVGRDASFEMELSRQYGCNVTSFDPTPNSIEYVRTLEPIKFRFIPWAIWVHDGHLDFYSQDLNNNVNLSAVDSGRGQHLCRVECYQLKTVMEKLGHPKVDLLKIDIEGGWMPVIENLVESGIAPRVFCVEFDSPASIPKVRRAVRLLSRLGLHLVHRERDNYLFVDKSILESKI